MSSQPPVRAARSRVRQSRLAGAPGRPEPRALTGGGTGGNQQLTAMVGVVLLVLLAGLGVTIVRIGPLIGPHLFLGFLLIGPVGAKLASTGYRFARYYAGDQAYRRKGPPPTALRVLAPAVVSLTVVVFASGVVLLFEGPAHRSLWLLIHKASFFGWLGATALHVLGHLFELPASLRAAHEPAGRPSSGRAGRWITIGGSLVGGLVLAIALLPQFASWTNGFQSLHH